MTLVAAAQLPLVLPPYPQGLREPIEQVCTIIGVRPNVIAEWNSTRVQLDLAHTGLGFAILPKVSFLRYEHTHELTAIPITSPGLHRQLLIAHLVADESTPARSIVTDLILRRLGKVLQ